MGSYFILICISFFLLLVFYRELFNSTCSTIEKRNIVKIGEWIKKTLMQLSCKGDLSQQINRIVGVGKNLWRASPTPLLKQLPYNTLHRKAPRQVLSISREYLHHHSVQPVPVLSFPKKITIYSLCLLVLSIH